MKAQSHTRRPITTLKNRIAWEIQALKDRQVRNAEILERRRAYGIPREEIDAALDAEGKAINERIEALTALNKARLSLRRIARDLPRVLEIYVPALKKERAQILAAVREVRVALAI